MPRRAMGYDVVLRQVCVVGLATLLCLTLAVEAGIRVGCWNIAQLRGDFTAITDVMAEASADDSRGFAVPVAVWVFQEVDVENVPDLHDLLGPEYSQGTYTSSNEDTYSGAQAMFYHSSLVTEITSGHADIYTGAGRRSDRWQIRLLGYDNPPIDFYIYSSHLKASTGSKNQAERLFGIEQLLEDAAKLPVGSRIIYSGDYNFYSSGESGYEALVAEGPVGAIDPFGNGTWSGESNAIKHSQSPRDVSAGGLIGGSLDDRFDFQLPTIVLSDGVGMDSIPDTYRSLGNDGNHYDVAINDGNNSYFPGDNQRSNALADDLFDASDHLPVLVDYAIPAILGASMTESFNDVIVGGSVDLALVVENDVDVPVPACGAALPWSATGTGFLSSVNESGSIPAGSGPDVRNLQVATTTAGQINEVLDVTSSDPDVQNAPMSLGVSGTVLRHANGSLSGDHDSDFFVISDSVESDTGIHVFDVQLHNYGWDSLQAGLDLDSVEIPASPFSHSVDPIQGIEDQPVTLSFLMDTQGLVVGSYIDSIAISVSDEDLPGATDAVLTLVLSIEVTEVAGCDGDFTGDGVTDVADLLMVISEWGSPYDVTHLLAVIGDWDCSAGP